MCRAPGGFILAGVSRSPSPLVPAPEADARPPGRRGPGWGGVVLGIALILALLAGFIFYEAANFPLRAFDTTAGRMERWAGKARDAFVAVAGMQPRVVVNERVVFEQSSPVLELAVLEREASVERATEDTWLGSTKHLRVRGLYRIKAGYDLQRPFTIRLDGADAAAVRLQMPRARVLSVELEKLDVLSADNGLWNRVQPEEFAQQVDALNLDARQKARDGGMLADTEKSFAAQLQGKLGSDHRLEIVNDPPPEPLR